MSGDLRVIKGLGRAKVSVEELDRFLGATRDYQPSRPHKANAAKRKTLAPGTVHLNEVLEGIR